MASIRELNSEEAEALEAGLNLAARLAEVDGPLSLDQTQALYDRFLAARVDDQACIIALGVAFGHCLVGSGPVEWVRYSDEAGDVTSIAMKHASIVIHPISMIEKRLAAREPAILDDLCHRTLETLGEAVKKGGYARR
jgi:hypothetical protein